jgi:hypothetical protein
MVEYPLVPLLNYLKLTRIFHVQERLTTENKYDPD